MNEQLRTIIHVAIAAVVGLVMSLGFVHLTPMVVGAITIYGMRASRPTWTQAAFAPWAATALMMIGAMVTLLEGAICVVLMTPLFLALLMVEVTDLIFAVDSIPAIFAITADPFLVFTSNVFAVLGLRSLYFALAGMIRKFRHLKVALAAVLMVVGLKMLFAEWLKATVGSRFNFYLLGVVVAILAAGVISSLIADRRAVSHP